GGTGDEMQGGMSDRREIDQDRLPVMLLERYGGVDRQRGRAASALGINDGEHARFACGAASAPRGGEAGEGLQQAFSSGQAIRKLAGTGPHGADHRHRPAHVGHGEDSDIAGSRADQFYGMDGALRVVGIDIDESYFSAMRL